MKITDVSDANMSNFIKMSEGRTGGQLGNQGSTRGGDLRRMEGGIECENERLFRKM